MKARVHRDLRRLRARRNIQLTPNSVLAAGKNRFAARMVSMQPFRNGQYFLQVLAQRGLVAIALCFAQNIAHQVFGKNRFFTVRLVLRRVWLEIKSDGAPGGRFKLRQLANFFTRYDSQISFSVSLCNPGMMQQRFPELVLHG